jgi:putative intracellular protease/amidase
MKKLRKMFFALFAVAVVAGLVGYFPLQEAFAHKLKVYRGSSDFSPSKAILDAEKKTVVIMADNDGTEMFDLLAPYYLFNASGRANVFVVSGKKAPILLVNSLFILPHYSFSELDSLHIVPDVIVIPNMTVHLKTPPKASNVAFIRSHYSDSTIILSVCDGSATAAATGIYDGKPLTTHATDFNTLKDQFPKPAWVRGVSVTQSGNLYSTAGVSNAVEGSLAVIKRLFGTNTMQSVLRHIKYPHGDIKVDHKSEVVDAGKIARIVSKILFRKNSRIGVLLTDSVNEFELASILDTYVRSFPKSINSFSAGGRGISSKYGLTLYPTGDLREDQIGELHVAAGRPQNAAEQNLFAGAHLIQYGSSQQAYPIDQCLERISGLYGRGFEKCVRLMLDYN